MTWLPQPGDRVVCRPSLECPVKGEPTSWNEADGVLGHRVEEDGRTGTVYEDRCHPRLHAERQGHPYLVAFDEPFWVGGRRIGAMSYAAIELEPLSPEAPAR